MLFGHLESISGAQLAIPIAETAPNAISDQNPWESDTRQIWEMWADYTRAATTETAMISDRNWMIWTGFDAILNRFPTLWQGDEDYPDLVGSCAGTWSKVENHNQIDRNHQFSEFTASNWSIPNFRFRGFDLKCPEQGVCWYTNLSHSNTSFNLFTNARMVRIHPKTDWIFTLSNLQQAIGMGTFKSAAVLIGNTEVWEFFGTQVCLILVSLFQEFCLQLHRILAKIDQCARAYQRVVTITK